MAHTTATAGPYYSSGEITFDSLRSNFRARSQRTTFSGTDSVNTTDTAPIKASELVRYLSSDIKNPVVPNCTENASIASANNVGDAASNWKTSQFRGSIKFYYIQQSSTNTTVNINNLSWNSNRQFNIKKIYFIDGTIGSSAPGTPAASMSGVTVNFEFKVSGNIWGAAGRGGGTGSGAPAISGQGGGSSLQLTLPNSSRNVVVNALSTSKIYAGGGGGEKGNPGGRGSSANCYESSSSTGCGSCPSCPGGFSFVSCTQGGGCANKRPCNWWGNCWRVTNKWYQTTKCEKRYTILGGNGGAGGNGGIGRGYNNQTADLKGSPGIGGSPGSSCPGGNSGKGVDGGNGGPGGNWGGDGTGTPNSGTFGTAGKAIFGTNYTVIGSKSKIKGAYNP